MSTLPFRFVTFGEGAPYPDSEIQQPAQQPFMVDFLSGDHWHRGSSLRQPVAEGFLRPQYPLPPPPVEEHGSDQELPIIEPDSYLENFPASDQFHDGGVIDLDRRDTIATTKPLKIVKPDASHRRSHTALELPLVVPRPPSPFETEHQDTSVYGQGLL